MATTPPPGAAGRRSPRSRRSWGRCSWPRWWPGWWPRSGCPPGWRRPGPPGRPAAPTRPTPAARPAPVIRPATATPPATEGRPATASRLALVTRPATEGRPATASRLALVTRPATEGRPGPGTRAARHSRPALPRRLPVFRLAPVHGKRADHGYVHSDEVKHLPQQLCDGGRRGGMRVVPGRRTAGYAISRC